MSSEDKEATGAAFLMLNKVEKALKLIQKGTKNKQIWSRLKSTGHCGTIYIQTENGETHIEIIHYGGKLALEKVWGVLCLKGVVAGPAPISASSETPPIHLLNIKPQLAT